MTKADDRIDDFKEVIKVIDGRVKELEDKVAEGNKPIMEKIEEQDKRIIVLENAEANKALEDKRQFWRTARTTVLGVVITSIATFSTTVFIVSSIFIQ